MPVSQQKLTLRKTWKVYLIKIVGQRVLTEILQFLANQLRNQRKKGELANCGKCSKYLFVLLGNISILIKGDGATWIKEGAKDYFPNCIYQLCPFHLKRESEINSLLQGGNISEALLLLEEEKSKNSQKKDELNELATYLIDNSEGINAVDCLKEEGLPVLVGPHQDRGWVK